MANKKITELPYIVALTGSVVPATPNPNTYSVVPVVLYGTTNQITIENFSKFMNLYTATTSSNTFIGNQTINGNVSISGKLTVTDIVAQYETASILFSSGSNKFGDELTDKHEITGSSNFTGSFYINGQDYTIYSSSNSATITNFSSSNSATFTNNSSSNAIVIQNYSSSNSAVFTINSSSNAIVIQNFSSSNSVTFTNNSSSNAIVIQNFSSSNSVTFTDFSSSNSATFTNNSSSNAIVIQNYSSSNSATFTNNSSSNAIVIQNYSSSNSAVFTDYSSSDSTKITNYSSSINSTLFDTSASINTNIYVISSSINSTLFATSASINTNIYAISASIDATIKNEAGQVLFRVMQATASIQSYTASLKAAILPNNTNLDIFGNLRVSGSTTLGDNNTDKVEVTGSVNVTGYVSASGINIYSTGTPEIISSNNLRLTAGSSVVITTDDAGTPKVWDFDNGGTINLPGGATISTPNTVDVIVAAGTLGTAQLANYNKSNYFAINDSVASINVDAGPTNKVWQYTSSGSLNIPGSIVKPDGGEYSASLTLTSSFHAFTASIGSTSNDYRIELNSIEAYTASLKSAAIVSSSTQVQNYDVFALNSNLYIGTGSLQAQLNGLMGFTASLDNTYATDAQLLPILQATRSLELHSGSMIGITNELMSYTASLKSVGIVSSSNQLVELNTATGSIKDEIAGIEAYTASLKGAAIVSSSQQVQNYFTFAVTSSNNSFFGENTFTNKVTHTNGYIVLSQVSASLNFVDDTAAASGGVPLGGLYRNGNFIVIRIV